MQKIFKLAGPFGLCFHLQKGVIMRIFIGVGHGGSDPGAVANNLKEKDINQDIAIAMKAFLEKHGIIVGISRFKDEDDPIQDEIREANAFKADLAIDIHTNAGGGIGFEALVQNGKHKEASKKLAESIEKEVKNLGQVSRGLKTRVNKDGSDYFGFLRQINSPAVILECAFIDSQNVEKIDTKSERVAFGVAYAKGVLEFLGIKPKAKEIGNLTKIEVDDHGKIYQIEVDSLTIGDQNHIKLRSLEQIKSIKIDYNPIKKLPIIRILK